MYIYGENYIIILLSGIFALTYVNFFWDDLGLQQTYFIIGQIIYAVINSLNDFYFGRISDKTDIKKWGSRRLIYIKWGGVLWAFIFFSIWFPWSYTNQIIIFIHFIVSISAFDMMLSLVWLVWLALMPELTESTDERNKMALNNQYFLILGALPVLISFLIFDSGLLTFQIFAGACALICGVCYYFIGSNLKERPELHFNQETIPLFRALKEVLKSRSYITMTLFRVFNQLNGALGLSFMFAYVLILGVDILTASLLYYVLSTVIALIGYFIYKKLSMRISMRNLVVRGRIIQITINVVGFFIILNPEFEIFIWIILIGNAITNGFLILGTNAFFNKIAESIGPIIGTTILLLFGFIRSASFQTTTALIGVKFLLLIVPSIINLLGLISIYYFPLYDEKLKEMQIKLNKIHQDKSKIYFTDK
jgi:Na+/melibiose symporter-like transporter